MGRGNGSSNGDEGDEDLDEEFPRAPVADGDADVTCPYCGETISITLDPGGGSHQQYVEDCEVCCRPWQVHVDYDYEGLASVSIEPAQ